jgi:hypothetical protein
VGELAACVIFLSKSFGNGKFATQQGMSAASGMPMPFATSVTFLNKEDAAVENLCRIAECYQFDMTVKLPWSHRPPLW